VRGDPIQEQDLMGPQAQDLADTGPQAIDRLPQQALQRVIEAAAPAQHAKRQFSREGSFCWREVCAL
jgi:hypothetical protein